MRRNLSFVAALALVAIALGLSASTADALLLVQRPGESYMLFEAETYDTLVSHDGKGFVPVDRTPTFTSPVGTPVLPAGTTASAQAALIDDPRVGNSDHSSTVTYRLMFRTPGTYRMYVRDSAFEDGGNTGNYGNEDSFYSPPSFGAAATVTQHGYSGNTEGNYGWRNLTDANYVVTPADVGQVLDLNIDDRESGFSLDRIALSTSTSESGGALDNKVNASGLPFGSPGPAVLDLDWWANRTADSGVYEATTGGARLDDVNTGFIEGTIALPFGGAWLVEMPFRSDESGSRDPDDTADLFIDGSLVGTAYNTPAAATTLLSTVVFGSSFDYRVEFSSSNAQYHLHMQSWPGFATQVIVPEPTTALVWSLLAGLGIGVGWRRRRR